MNEQPSPQPRPKRWKWITGIAAAVFFSTTIAALAILWSIDFNKLKPLLNQLIKRETGRDLDIRGAIDFKFGLRPSLIMDDVSFQNAPWASRPEMVKVKRVEAKIQVIPLLNKEIRIARLVLLEPDVLLETDKSGNWNFEFEKPGASSREKTPPRSFTLPKMSFEQVQVEKGRVSYRDGSASMFCCLSIDRFTARSEGFESPVVLALSGSYKDKPLEVNGIIGSLLLLKNPGKGYPVDLTVKAAGAQLKMEGTIQDILNLKGLSLNASAEVQSTSQLAAFLGKSLQVEFGPLQTTAAISNAGEETYTLSDFRISSRAGDALGNLTLILGGGRRPKLSGSLLSRSLDLTPFLNRGKTTKSKRDNSVRKNRIFPSEPLPLDIPKNVDVHLKFDAGQLRLAQLPLASLSTEATLHEGRLVLRPIKVKVAGGDAEGRVEMEAQRGLATAKAVFKVCQMDLRLLSADLNAEGKADVELDLFSRGSSIAELMAGLNGRTVLVMGHGKVDNKNIRILGGDLASGVLKLLNPSSKAAEHTDINCGVSVFDIMDGMAKVTALVADTPDMTMIGEGQVNLRDETLDLALKPYTKGGTAGLSLSLGELAKSFKLGGTLANPSVHIDAEQTMFASLKAAAGVLLFGPAGIVAALAGQSLDGENPCLAALESARKGVRGSGNEKGERRNGAEEKGITSTLKGVGESVKKLFKAQGTQPQPDSRPDPYGGP